MSKLPENLIRLLQGMDVIKEKSIEAIAADSDLTHHISIIEKSMNIFNVEIAESLHPTDEDLKTIQLIGIRLFNASGAALKLAMSGYYQNAAIIARDLLETTFLIQYFRANPATISEWRNADEKKLKKDFSPIKIRIYLDKKDGFEEKKRAEAYNLLSRLATHMTYDGFRMLAPKGHTYHCGPYFDESVLKPIIEEIVKSVGQAGITYACFFYESTSSHDVHLDFLESIGKWMEKYLNIPFDQDYMDEMKFHHSTTKNET